MVFLGGKTSNQETLKVNSASEKQESFNFAKVADKNIVFFFGNNAEIIWDSLKKAKKDNLGGVAQRYGHGISCTKDEGVRNSLSCSFEIDTDGSIKMNYFVGSDNEIDNSKSSKTVSAKTGDLKAPIKGPLTIQKDFPKAGENLTYLGGKGAIAIWDVLIDAKKKYLENGVIENRYGNGIGCTREGSKLDTTICFFRVLSDGVVFAHFIVGSN